MTMRPTLLNFSVLPSVRCRLLVGVSGGADSVALLHLLAEAGYRRLVVCHLDHRLRGASSAGDARFVKRLAERLGLEAVVGRDDVRERMVGGGMSMETAAREARHAFFARCARQFRCRRMVLAHHADDQAETVLWNLLRGSYGLRGMRGAQELVLDGVKMTLLRPLLGCRRAELADWLLERGLAWREDASNAEPVAVRNRLRHEVFPLLAEICGRDPVPPLARAAADAAELDALLGGWLADRRLRDPQGRLHLPSLRELPRVMQRMALRDFLKDHAVPGTDRALVERGLGLLEPGSAAVVNLPGGRRLRRTAGRLWIDR